MTKVILLKTRTCTVNCSKVSAELTKRDIEHTFVVIDQANEAHMAIVETSQNAGYNTSPVICLQDSDDTLRFISAGAEPIAILTLKSALQKRAVSASAAAHS